MMGVKAHEPDESEFVEVDPTGRYGRYNEILGKGASKTVYRAFDEYEGIEVAWNQVKLYDFLQSPEDLERLYCEIHLLKTLKHKNIMKFYTSWVDTSKRNINFITEMFTSGTLRQYRQKHKRVNIRAVKHWCRQILRGLLYLHNHDPPVIHRDLKCDNIFVNGNQGEVKIGDLGLAAILRKSHAAHCVGTPEFMAPEVYEEEYNELVDIYSFGMCVLEMVTFEYPYSECTHPVQIYKKVVSGAKPEALYRVMDPEVRQFVEKCLATVSQRLTARELLNDPFLQIEDLSSGRREAEISEKGYFVRQPSFNLLHSNGPLTTNGFYDDLQHDDLQHETGLENGWNYIEADTQIHGIDLCNSQEDEPFANVDITIEGTEREDGAIFLMLRVADKEGQVRNIYFTFDIEGDTALSVATEMVAELDITDYDVTRIAEMIDSKVSSLVPDWKPGPFIEEMPGFPNSTFRHNCGSSDSSCDSHLEHLSSNIPDSTKLQPFHCSLHESTATHGRFEQISYQVDGSDQCVTERKLVLSTSQSDGLDLCSQAERENHFYEEGEGLDQLSKDEKVIHMNSHIPSGARKSFGELCCDSIEQQSQEMPESGNLCPPPNMRDDYENEIHKELRWLKAKYQMELREYRNQQFGGTRRALDPSQDINNRHRVENGITDSSVLKEVSNDKLLKSFHLGTHFSFRIPHGKTSPIPTSKNSPGDINAGYYWSSLPDLEAQRAQQCVAIPESSPEKMFTARSFYTGFILPNSLHRTKSLPVDAVDFGNL